MARPRTDVNNSHVLLVEGESDRGFFEQVCKRLSLHPTITVAAPKDYQGQARNGKQGVLALLTDLLGNLLDEAAELKCLAVVVDADYQATYGLGYQDTLAQVTAIATAYDFALATPASDGLLFKHSDGLIEFGLWIMPNNQDEGMLEDFVKTCICTDEQLLFAHATQSIAALPAPKFKPHHNSKAEVATWLAWQKTPGHSLYTSVNDNLLDTDALLFRQLGAWLQHIYQPLA